MKTIVDLVTSLQSYFTGKDTAAKQAVEANIAPVETDATASAHAYSVGDQLILNDVLYDVTAAIAVSDPLATSDPGANISAATKIGAWIKTLGGNIGDLTQLGTTDKSSAVAAINEVNTGLASKASAASVSDLSTAVSNKHKVTIETVSTSGWATDTTSQSGTTLYKKSISLTHVYVESPSVDIGASGGAGLPTAAEQTAYDLLEYVTVDGTTLYLYASAIPSTQFYIAVEGVD